jgi:hypothetical protein
MLWNREAHPETPFSPPIEPLLQRLDDALQRFSGGAFVRLGSRSGKDSVYARTHGMRVTTSEEAVRLLTQGSARVAFDLQLARRHSYTPHLFARQWLDIHPSAEFRCFMKQRRLVGISQYDCKNHGHFPEIARNAAAIRDAICSFFPRLAESSHLDDVVFDVFISDFDSITGLQVRLLELNPFHPKTDACLFSWAKPAGFDGSLRFM